MRDEPSGCAGPAHDGVNLSSTVHRIVFCLVSPTHAATLRPQHSPDASHVTAESCDIGDVESVGTLVQILEMSDTSDGNLRMVLEGHRRYVVCETGMGNDTATTAVAAVALAL